MSKNAASRICRILRQKLANVGWNWTMDLTMAMTKVRCGDQAAGYLTGDLEEGSG
jgi:hypothetical protein